jgi:hypothetical protein
MSLVRCNELSVITKCELEQYAGPPETHRYSRGDNLVIQGIITFFTGIPLTVYHNNGSSGGIIPIEYEKPELNITLRSYKSNRWWRRIGSQLIAF